MNPDKTLGELILWPDMKAADFGCGSGNWTIPLAKKLRKGTVYGLVYGIDVLDESLSALESRMLFEKVGNIRTLRANLEKDSTLASDSLDVVLATNIFFQAEDKESLLGEIKKVLKQGGQALIVDWMAKAPFGPKRGAVSADDIKNMALARGFKVKKEFKAGAYHWGMVLIKG